MFFQRIQLFLIFFLCVDSARIQKYKIIKFTKNGTCLYRNKLHLMKYTLPYSNNTVKGLSFSCSLLKYLKYFKMLDDNSYVDLSKERMPRPKVVTAFSENHREEAALLLASFKKHFPKQKIIVYNLGLSKKTKKFIKKLCFVEFRNFNFKKYPKHVSNIMNYAFKILVLAEVLKEHGTVIWADASVRFRKRKMKYVYNLFNCKNGKPPNHKYEEQKEIEKIHNRKDFKNIYRHLKCKKCFWKYRYSGFDSNVYKFNINHCYKSDMLLTIPTFHGILSTTHPTILEYFPTNLTRYDNKTTNYHRQYDAAFSITVKTKDIVQKVLKWAVLCALTKNCIEAEKWHGCVDFTKKNIFSSTNICYRFDQTIISLLLHNSNNYDNRNYVTEIHDFVDIVRESKIKLKSLKNTC
uniref:CAP10 domain-containing protein n=1 Tax=Strongyloides stercoralis TaxID=6248 RepID=A0A0K0ENT8_STRER